MNFNLHQTFYLFLKFLFFMCKLNKQGDNIQPWRTPFAIWNQSVVPCPVINPQFSSEAVTLLSASPKSLFHSLTWMIDPDIVSIHFQTLFTSKGTYPTSQLKGRDRQGPWSKESEFWLFLLYQEPSSPMALVLLVSLHFCSISWLSKCKYYF